MLARKLLAALVLICLFSAPAMAANVVDEKKPAVGAHVYYSWVPNGFLDMGYEEHTSLSSLAYGVWTSYGFGAYDLQLRVSNWSIFIDDGIWRSQGGTLKDQFYVETNGFGLLDLDLSVLWKWRVHEAVEPYVGPTVGMGFFYGELTVDDYYDQGDLRGSRKHKPETKNIPPVVPIAGFMGGCRFYPMPNMRLSVDLGFANGFYGGLSAGYAF